MPRRSGWYLVCVVVLLGLSAACGQKGGPTPALPTLASGPTQTNPALASTTPLATAAPTLTATPEPLALTVNGQDITLATYQRELARCQAGKTGAGTNPADCPAAVVQQLTEQAVVEQAAAAAGLSVPDADVDAALNKISAGLGGPGALTAWLTANHYESGEFRGALKADLLRARMIEKVTAGVGPTAEQVHAREILVDSGATAVAVLAQLQVGADFATLALEYSRDLSSRAAGGDLGWFPRGVLTVPEVEAAAFSLQPGQTSAVIHSALGYHIVQVLERDPARPLSPAAAQSLRAAAYTAWLQAQLAKAVVVKHITP